MMGKGKPLIFYFILMFFAYPMFMHGADHKSLNDIKSLTEPEEISVAYSDIINHYYNFGDIDSLRIVTYACIKWSEENDREKDKYQAWRQYIQRMTEKGMQDEAIKETELLQKDAREHNSQYGLASGEMCIGYNHRVFSNNIKLCLEYYDRALNLFEKSECYRDAFVVYLNTIQIYLSTQTYTEALNYLERLQALIQSITKKGDKIDANLTLRFYQFRVIATIADKGKKAAEKYIKEADQYYFTHPASATKEAWFGYKILCARSTAEWNTVLSYLDSLQNYHQSIGACYPANQLFRAQCLESLGRYQEACQTYAYYAHQNDSVRKVELDDKLSKYTVQFEVDKLKMDKLELNAKISQNRLVTVITMSVLVLILLIIITIYYIRTLAMNKKIDKAYQAAEKASQMKTAFIQNISHELRTPLNSIVGFSALIASSVENEENKQYAELIEENNAYLLDMINNVIAIADMDSQTNDGPKTTFDLDVCCLNCIDAIKESLNKDVELIYLPSVRPLMLTAVKSWVEKVLLCLLSNAGKFTQKGEIRFSYEEDKTNRCIRFIIEDTGLGIEEKYKENIFERFFKIDTFTRGTGLGLSVSKQIIDLAGGKIYLDTIYKNGARFIVEWPV